MAVATTENDARAFYVIQLDIVLGSLCTAAVGLRLAARWKGKAKFGLDDGFIVASLILFYSMGGCSVLRMYQCVCSDKHKMLNISSCTERGSR
jgi:hypothetical protein